MESVLADLTKTQERIYKILQVAKTIRIDQIYDINRDYPKSKTDKDIRILVRKKLAFYSKHEDFLMANPKFVPDKRMTDALWIILRQITNIPIDMIYVPEPPATLGFIKPNRGYEILAANSDQELVENLRKLEENFTDQSFDAEMSYDYTRYVIVTHNKDFKKVIPVDLKIPFVIAYEDYYDGLVIKSKPEISFFKVKNKNVSEPKEELS